MRQGFIIPGGGKRSQKIDKYLLIFVLTLWLVQNMSINSQPIALFLPTNKETKYVAA